MSPAIHLEKYYSCLDTACPIEASGKVTKVIGLVIEALGPASQLGTVCDIFTKGRQRGIGRVRRVGQQPDMAQRVRGCAIGLNFQPLTGFSIVDSHI